MAWTTAVAIIVLLIYMLKNKEQHQARLMTEEDIFKSFDRKYWEYRANSPIKLKDNAEAYIRYNGEGLQTTACGNFNIKTTINSLIHTKNTPIKHTNV